METYSPASETVRSRTTPGDFFLQLGIIVTLYASAVSLASLLFQIINKALPDRLDYYFNQSGVLWATAVVIIMFPLYLILGWLFDRQLALAPEKKQAGIRRWLVFLTLFLAGLALAIDLVSLVYYFLSGEISTRFILKVLTVLGIAGLIFGYYIYDVRQAAGTKRQIKIGFAAAAAVLALGSIIASFAIFGTPGYQRKVRFDERRVNDLTGLQWQVVNYWQLKEKLPATLGDLNDPISSFIVPTDPETSQPYEYRATGPQSFSLCAAFGLSSEASRSGSRSIAMKPMSGGINENWEHGQGRTCFDRTIDPKLYPPRSAIPTKYTD